VVVATKAAEHRRTAVQTIEELIEYRITSGQYSVGQKLPSIRVLANNLSINRGVVEKAIRRLVEDRTLRSEAGRGVFVVRAPHVDPQAWRERTMKHVRTALLEARFSGLSESELLALVRLELARMFTSAQDRVFAFFECNRWDADTMARELTRQLHAPFAPVVLSEVNPRAPEWRRCKLFVTCLNHLAELQELFPKRRMIGVQYTPTTDSIVEVARLKRTVRLGVICHYSHTVDLFVRAIETVRSVTATCLVNAPAQMQALFKKVDAVVVSRFAYDRVHALRPSIPIITMELHLTDQSLAFLRAEFARHIQGEVGANRA